MYKSIRYFLTVLLFGLFTVQTNNAHAVPYNMGFDLSNVELTMYVLIPHSNTTYALNFSGGSGTLHTGPSGNSTVSWNTNGFSLTGAYIANGNNWNSISYSGNPGSFSGNGSFLANFSGNSASAASGAPGSGGFTNLSGITLGGNQFNFLANNGLGLYDGLSITPSGNGLFYDFYASLFTLDGGLYLNGVYYDACFYLDYNGTMSQIPEPATMGLLFSGLLGGVATRRRQKRALKA